MQQTPGPATKGPIAPPPSEFAMYNPSGFPSGRPKYAICFPSGENVGHCACVRIWCGFDPFAFMTQIVKNRGSRPVTMLNATRPVGAAGFGGAAVLVARAAGSGVGVTANATLVGTSVGAPAASEGIAVGGVVGTNGGAPLGLVGVPLPGTMGAPVGVTKPQPVTPITRINASKTPPTNGR
jgi:hypothetical protein